MLPSCRLMNVIQQLNRVYTEVLSLSLERNELKNLYAKQFNAACSIIGSVLSGVLEMSKEGMFHNQIDRFLASASGESNMSNQLIGKISGSAHSTHPN